jgi:hypothetical protein
LPSAPAIERLLKRLTEAKFSTTGTTLSRAYVAFFNIFLGMALLTVMPGSQPRLTAKLLFLEIFGQSQQIQA